MSILRCGGLMTWKELAAHYPEFVQWVVARHGGLPEGPIQEEDYNRFAAEFERRAS